MLRIINHNQLNVTTMQFNSEGEMDIPKKILVVEDEFMNQYVAKSLLEIKGYQVDIADTGQTALSFYQTNHYAAILMDLDLPDMQGTEITQQIRKLEKINGTRIPIIALTAHSSATAKDECLTAGMDGFSTKPIEIEQLVRLLKTWIAKSN